MVLVLAVAFQAAWNASRDAEAIGSFTDNVFAPDRASAFYGESPLGAISARSFSRGKLSIEPRDLLDALGLELLHKRKMLYRCERPGCGRYFVKAHSRKKTCSDVCSEELRRERQTEWIRQHRKEAKERSQKKGRKP